MWIGPQMGRQCCCYSSSLAALLRETIFDIRRFRIIEKRRFAENARQKRRDMNMTIGQIVWGILNVQFGTDNSHCVLIVHVWHKWDF